MNKSHFNQSTLSFSAIDYGVIILTTLTALVHLILSFQFSDGPDPIFLLNGLGYLTLLALLYWPAAFLVRYRAYVRWLLLGYTLLTVVLWYFLGPRPPSIVAYVDKAIEIVLIILLWLEISKSKD